MDARLASCVGSGSRSKQQQQLTGPAYEGEMDEMDEMEGTQARRHAAGQPGRSGERVEWSKVGRQLVHVPSERRLGSCELQVLVPVMQVRTGHHGLAA